MIKKTITMPEAMADWVTDEVAKGRFEDESACFQHLISKEQARLDVQAIITESQNDISEGRYTTLKNREEIDTFIGEICTTARERHAADKNK